MTDLMVLLMSIDFLFRAMLYNLEAKSSLQMGQIRRSFYPMFASRVHVISANCSFGHVSEREILFNEL